VSHRTKPAIAVRRAPDSLTFDILLRALPKDDCTVIGNRAG